MQRRRFKIITLTSDIFILAISFLIMGLLKPAGLRSYIPSHSLFFGILVIIWLLVSLINGKMHRGKIINYSSLLTRVIGSNLISISITALLMYTFRDLEYSRTVVLGTALLATIIELILGGMYISYKKAILQDYEDYDSYIKYKKPSEYELVSEINERHINPENHTNVHPSILKAIESEAGPEIAKSIAELVGPKLNDHTAVLSTTSMFNITSLLSEQYAYIINLHRINDIKDLDKFIDSVNSKLVMKGHFLCFVETKDQRKRRILKKFPPLLNYIFYSFDFIIKRILPKLKATRPLYFFLTRGNNAVISRAEALGRLARGGFKIKKESFVGNLLCIEARKVCEPQIVKENFYGPLIALPRIGRDGRIIKVYKLRTMHPYSEYIQDYVYNMHDLKEGGKFKNDFRITTWGAFCRKIWIDELPMLINVFKGDMKLVGVRPLSQHYFTLYREDIQVRRINYKPGLIPPFYADLPNDLDGIQASELKYLEEYDKHPLWTDIKYFGKSGWNILFKYARSN